MPSGIYKRKKGLKRNPLSMEHKLKISKSMKLNPTRYWLGKKHSPEHIRKIKLSRKGYKPSEETKQKQREVNLKLGIKPPVRKGSDNNLWKGGITPENHRVRTSTEYKLWRKSIFERDNFICQKCGQLGGTLRAHHINNFSEYRNLRLSLDNGITLCNKCHTDFHKQYGIKNNTLGQLEEFIWQ